MAGLCRDDVRTKLVDLGMTHCHSIHYLYVVEDTGRQTERKGWKGREGGTECPANGSLSKN